MLRHVHLSPYTHTHINSPQTFYSTFFQTKINHQLSPLQTTSLEGNPSRILNLSPEEEKGDPPTPYPLHPQSLHSEIHTRRDFPAHLFKVSFGPDREKFQS
ncbi:hypothetical protein CEXT_231901 [Caerostris extrusa]|uniref:Uncharacterized protein n=1 Tax=Caerostris extrusa TaxID=172846 RepID=A0AAV4QNH7_CAEEX|nr:hypothetical protein CEXT_231901 [Caerostris extrusa]